MQYSDFRVMRLAIFIGLVGWSASCKPSQAMNEAVLVDDRNGEDVESPYRPFEIRRTTPARGHQAVRADSVIRIFFTHSLDQNANDLSQLISIEPPVNIVESGIEQHTVLLIPEKLEFGTTYTVTIHPGFVSKGRPWAVETLSSTYTWTFTTFDNALLQQRELTEVSDLQAQVMRVQGGACQNASRDHIGPDGSILLDSGRLYFTVASLPIAREPQARRWNGMTRSAGFFRRRLSGWTEPSCSNPNDLHPVRSEPYVVCFRVSHAFLDFLRQTSIPEHLTRAFPDRPQLVDVNGGDDQYGLLLSSSSQLLEAARLPEPANCHPAASKGCNGENNQREPSDLLGTERLRIAEFLDGPCYAGLAGTDSDDIDLVIRADEKR